MVTEKESTLDEIGEVIGGYVKKGGKIPPLGDMMGKDSMIKVGTKGVSDFPHIGQYAVKSTKEMMPKVQLVGEMPNIREYTKGMEMPVLKVSTKKEGKEEKPD